MRDVAQARKFDQQNARELCGLQRRSVRVLCACVFDLAVQLAKLNRTNELFQRDAHQRCEDASAGDKGAAQRA